MNRFSTRFKRASWRKALFGKNRSLPQTGHRTYVDPSAQFIGAKLISIGGRSIISEGCWFNVNDRSGCGLAIDIGDHCYIGRRSFFSSGRKIKVGPYCMIGNESNLLGADHDFSDPFRPYLVAPATATDDILLGANCWLGSNSTVLKGITIGYGSVVGAGSVVTKSIPPFSVAVGNPCRVVRRFSVARKQWIPHSEWTPKDEEALPGSDRYLEALRRDYEWLPMPYVIGGERMGDV